MITPENLTALLGPIPRVMLCQTPSALEPWSRLAQHWCPGSRLFAKRDDLVGPGMGGNKSRQLEFILGAALAQGADTIIHGGAIQSNYCRQLSSAAALLGLECHLVLSTAYGQPANQGSHLLSRLFGARITTTELPLGSEHEQIKLRLRDQLRAQGRNPYLITYPQSEILGSLGYVSAAAELVGQFPGGEPPDVLVTAAVGASYAGLLLGLRLMGQSIPVIGIAPLRGEYDVVNAVREAITEASALLDVNRPRAIDADIDIRYTQVGDGYALATPAGLSALNDCARLQGVLLDPVYTAKACAAVRDLLQPGKTLVFLHTGGAPAVFAYGEALVGSMGEAVLAAKP
ncbi:1-aminocyclopropane-1-carboxylate deaminase [Micromonospora sonchi]|uniref:1-aminocyclopropane-1-carboxylate deaminase n=1 Tax=Micromonospora sonchi TaxID=1763543 RepID=A0A917X4K9_9ACTN|nr:pyridoxal-phosphate dependent enzyme [Micromonospora sonchi]GGM65914.1 1-aminocyclopropane-1-carboxylate deaminase [Micromonospora sonchi]